MDKPKQLTPQEVDHAVSELRRQLQGLEQQLPERIDCSQETIEQGLAKLVLGLIELLRQLWSGRRSAAWKAARSAISRWKTWAWR